MRIASKIVIVLAVSLLLAGCKIYSFTGANIDPAIQSVSISYFINESGNGPATAGDLFTEALKTKMLNNTNLNQVNANGDIHFSGEIIDYAYSIQAPTGDVSSDLKRITMRVSVQFENRISPADSWTESFSAYVQYPVDEGLEGQEEVLIEEINTQIVDKVFNRAFVNW